MDLNFGEIVLDPISRAFIDDYEEESLFIRPEIVFKTSDEQRKCFKGVEHLIVIEGFNAEKVLKNAGILNNLEHICKIRSTDIYELEKSTMVCVSEEKDLNYLSSVCDLLDDLIKNAKEVTMISLQRLMDYKSDKIPEDCIIRAINSKFKDIEALSSPNFITGLTAGISTKRVLNDSTFSCYVIYVDLYDEITIRKILNHFQRVGVKYDESMKVKSINEKCNLYM